MIDVHSINKELIAPLQAAMYDFDEAGVRAALHDLIAPDAIIHMPNPFGDMTGPDELYDNCYKPLFEAMPDLWYSEG